MSFISVLLALLIEQARPLPAGNAVHALLRAWMRLCQRNLDAGQGRHAALVWVAAVLGPAVLAWGVFVLAGWGVGWPLSVLWSAAVLYLTLGFRQFSNRFTQVRDALLEGDEAAARAHMARWQVRGEPLVAALIEASVIAAHRHVFGVLLWFSLGAALGLGPAGAVVYRLAEFLPRYSARQISDQAALVASPNSLALAQQAWQHIDWLPVRLTAVVFAVVGNFEETIDSWRRLAHAGRLDNDSVLLAATAGAINLNLPSLRPLAGHDGETAETLAQRPQPEWVHLSAMVGLLWRGVVLWLLLLALLTLARLLG